MRLLAIGGSDAGISAALRARELDPSAEVTVVVADAYPNFSICGIPYYVSGEVTDWRNLAHRTARGSGGHRHDAAPRHHASPASTSSRTASCSTGRQDGEDTLDYDALDRRHRRCPRAAADRRA